LKNNLNNSTENKKNKSDKNLKKDENKYLEKNLFIKLARKKMQIEEFYSFLKKCPDKFFQNTDLETELLLANGLPLVFDKNLVYLQTLNTRIQNQVFCVVDIETNGNNVQEGQIIEIGALKYKNGEILDKYESLVYAKKIPSYVQGVTNISPQMLVNAPSLEHVLQEFKIFLDSDVFVAHDVNFDYNFISDLFEKYDLGKLQNRKLCTIKLAKRTIKAPRYGLDYLKELLNINIPNQHRAYSDALSASYVLKESLKQIKKYNFSTEELIEFSKTAKAL